MTDHSAVFVVDDDASVRRAVERLLRSAGYRVRTFDSAPSVHNALSDAGLEFPSCLILDVRMAGSTGFDLMESLSVTRIPVIFITGDGGESIAARARKAGAVGLLSKPFDEDALLGAVRVACTSTGES